MERQKPFTQPTCNFVIYLVYIVKFYFSSTLYLVKVCFFFLGKIVTMNKPENDFTFKVITFIKVFFICRVLTQFDKAINAGLSNRTKTKLLFRAEKLNTYRFCDNVWTFMLRVSRQIDRLKQIDRQTDRQIDRQRERQIDRQTDKQ